MKRKSDTVFITTVFPNALGFLSDFFISLKNQDYKCFDVLIANDNVENKYLKELSEGLNINIIQVNASPAKNREIIIKKALQLGYKYFIFGDSDDYFSNNRIKVTLELLKNHDLIVNDLEIVGNINTNSFFSYYEEGFINENILFDYNIAGLSNTAIKSNVLKFTLNFPENIVAVDWLLFSQVTMCSNTDVYFTKKTKTFYRQHVNNTAGVSDTITYEIIKQIINVKKEHYETMIKFAKENNSNEFSLLFNRKLEEIQKIELDLLEASKREKYIKLINKYKSRIYKGWWSEIIPLKQLLKYK